MTILFSTGPRKSVAVEPFTQKSTAGASGERWATRTNADFVVPVLVLLVVEEVVVEVVVVVVDEVVDDVVPPPEPPEPVLLSSPHAASATAPKIEPRINKDCPVFIKTSQNEKDS